MTWYWLKVSSGGREGIARKMKGFRKEGEKHPRPHHLGLCLAGKWTGDSANGTEGLQNKSLSWVPPGS
jgi:hypothetical protein